MADDPYGIILAVEIPPTDNHEHAGRIHGHRPFGLERGPDSPFGEQRRGPPGFRHSPASFERELDGDGNRNGKHGVSGVNQIGDDQTNVGESLVPPQLDPLLPQPDHGIVYAV